MNAGRATTTVAPAYLTRFLIAFGLVPLLFASVDVARIHPPWSFALTPSWSLEQLAAIALAGAVLGVTATRPVQGLAAVTLGVLLGLAFDLWWLAGWVTSFDQTFVSLLPEAEWRSRAFESALILVGVVCAGFVVGVIARRLSRDRAPLSRQRLSRSGVVALAVIVIGAPLLALGIATAGASSALVVPDEAQVQTIRVSADGITVDPATLRPGPTRFRCQFTPDATAEWARILAVPEGASGAVVSPAFEDLASCGQEPGSETWGTLGDLQPGRYVWTQIEMESEPLEVITVSPIFVVAP